MSKIKAFVNQEIETDIELCLHSYPLDLAVSQPIGVDKFDQNKNLNTPNGSFDSCDPADPYCDGMLGFSFSCRLDKGTQFNTSDFATSPDLDCDHDNCVDTCVSLGNTSLMSVNANSILSSSAVKTTSTSLPTVWTSGNVGGNILLRSYQPVSSILLTDEVLLAGQVEDALTAQGYMWLADSAGSQLLRIHPDTRALVPIALPDPPSAIVEHNNLLYVSCNTRLVVVDPSTMTVVWHEPIGSASTTSIAVQDGYIWIAANTGLIRFTEGTNLYQTFGPTGFPHLPVGAALDTLVATQDTLWATDTGNGQLIKINTGYVVTDPLDDLIDQQVTSTSPAKAVYNTFDGLVYFIDTTTNEVRSLDPQTGADQLVVTMAATPRDLAAETTSLWVGTITGLFYYDLTNTALTSSNLIVGAQYLTLTG